MAGVQLRALGECALETGVGRICPDSRYVFALGLYLVLERGRRIPRQALVDLLWPDVRNEGVAKHRFRQTLLRLKQLGVPVDSDQSHLRLDRQAVATDFETLLNVNGDAEAVLGRYESFEFLQGYQPRISEQFTTWLDLHRARVELAIQRVFVHALKSARTRGDWEALERLALGCLRIDPLNEEANMARAEATAMRGSKHQALRILDTYLDAIGEKSLAIGLPAKLLRSRIAERLTEPRYTTLSETHFVGREEEVTLLNSLLDEAKAGRGAALLLLGASGIGKTRLVTEAAHIASLRGITLVAAQCQPTGADKPIGLLADLIEALRATRGSLGASVETLTLLQRLTDVRDSEREPLSGDGSLPGAAIRHAVFDLFDAVADENTLLITIEDAHWADGFSWNLVKAIAELTPRRRVLLLITARERPSYDPVGDAYDAFSARTLPPLGEAAAESLLAKLIADFGTTMPPEMLHWCATVAEGNPYYLRELLLRWLETGEPFGVPQSLLELVDRRLARLSGEALRVFQTCVTLGPWCTLARLERIQIVEPARLPKALEEVSLAGVLNADGACLRPRHELLAQAAHNRMVPALKALLHRRVASVLEEEADQEPVPSMLWECARHWTLAGEPDRAVAFLTNCGQHLMSVGVPEEAVVLFRRAMDWPLTEHSQRVALHEGLIRALRQCGLLDQVLSEIQTLREQAPLHGYDLPVHTELELFEFEAAWRTDRADNVTVERLRQCMAEPAAPADHRLNAASWLLAFAQRCGDSDLAHSTWKAAEPLVSNRAIDAASRHQLAMIYHTDYGDLSEAVRHASAFVSETRKTADAVSMIRALRNAALSMRRAGRFEDSRSLLTEAVEIGLRRHAALGAVEAANQLAAIALDEGDLDTAEAWLTRVEEWISPWESAMQRTDTLLMRTRVALARNDLERAASLADRLPAVPEGSKLRQDQFVVAVQLALAVSRSDSRVHDLTQVAMAIFQRLQDRGHQDYPVTVLAEAMISLGRSEGARSLLTEYVKRQRRDRGPLPPRMRRLLGELESVTTLMQSPVESMKA